MDDTKLAKNSVATFFHDDLEMITKKPDQELVAGELNCDPCLGDCVGDENCLLDEKCYVAGDTK